MLSCTMQTPASQAQVLGVLRGLGFVGVADEAGGEWHGAGGTVRLEAVYGGSLLHIAHPAAADLAGMRRSLADHLDRAAIATTAHVGSVSEPTASTAASLPVPPTPLSPVPPPGAPGSAAPPPPPGSPALPPPPAPARPAPDRAVPTWMVTAALVAAVLTFAGALSDPTALLFASTWSKVTIGVLVVIAALDAWRGSRSGAAAVGGAALVLIAYQTTSWRLRGGVWSGDNLAKVGSILLIGAAVAGFAVAVGVLRWLPHRLGGRRPGAVICLVAFAGSLAYAAGTIGLLEPGFDVNVFRGGDQIFGIGWLTAAALPVVAALALLLFRSPVATGVLLGCAAVTATLVGERSFAIINGMYAFRIQTSFAFEAGGLVVIVLCTGLVIVRCGTGSALAVGFPLTATPIVPAIGVVCLAGGVVVAGSATTAAYTPNRWLGASESYDYVSGAGVGWSSGSSYGWGSSSLWCGSARCSGSSSYGYDHDYEDDDLSASRAGAARSSSNTTWASTNTTTTTYVRTSTSSYISPTSGNGYRYAPPTSVDREFRFQIESQCPEVCKVYRRPTPNEDVSQPSPTYYLDTDFVTVTCQTRGTVVRDGDTGRVDDRWDRTADGWYIAQQYLYGADSVTIPPC